MRWQSLKSRTEIGAPFGECRALGRQRLGHEGLERFAGDGSGDVSACGLRGHGNGIFTIFAET
jgi:hypothetical protein